ncbi:MULTISPECIES: hypothetical protein [unclassified Microbacterium]|uniref:hypothetical protein n=1 Tax=unclassified Microbacterium TaxID=2609290 RepID=UPI00301A9B5D
MRPACTIVLATSVHDGKGYAEALGIEEFRIGTPLNASSLEGLITRAVVVTPRFAILLVRESLDPDSRARRVFDTANRNAMHSGAPRG